MIMIHTSGKKELFPFEVLLLLDQTTQMLMLDKISPRDRKKYEVVHKWRQTCLKNIFSYSRQMSRISNLVKNVISLLKNVT